LKAVWQVAGHGTVWFCAGVVIVSEEPPTVNVASVVAELPQASLAVKVTVIEPQVGCVTWQLLLHVTLLQDAVATAPPCVDIQLLKAV
jgi:hypothetical protein